jgi:hypothetical protein
MAYCEFSSESAPVLGQIPGKGSPTLNKYTHPPLKNTACGVFHCSLKKLYGILVALTIN